MERKTSKYINGFFKKKQTKHGILYKPWKMEIQKHAPNKDGRLCVF